jgi:hypothetical protein
VSATDLDDELSLMTVDSGNSNFNQRTLLSQVLAFNANYHVLLVCT